MATRTMIITVQFNDNDLVQAQLTDEVYGTFGKDNVTVNILPTK